MRSVVQKFRPELEQLMAEARTAIAATRFESVRVKTELTAAARIGRSSCLLVVDEPVDLRKAEATLALFAWCEQEGLRTEWLRRPVGDIDGNAAWDLLVSWRPPEAL